MADSSSTPLPSPNKKLPPSRESSREITTTLPKLLRTRKSKSKRPSGCLFLILRIMGILGPLGFVCNIIYFHVYMHHSDAYAQFRELHPLYEFSRGILDRLEHYSLSSGQLRERPRHDHSHDLLTLNGLQVLQKLQTDIQESWKECGQSTTSSVALARQLQNLDTMKLRGWKGDFQMMTPFAMQDVLQTFWKDSGLNDNSISNNNSKNTTNIAKQSNQPNQKNNNNQHLQQPHPLEQCQLPQQGSMAYCHQTNYSMIVTFQGPHNFRHLFLNLLSWVLWPNIADILVLMPHDDWRFEGQSTMEAKYKERIKAWHTDGSHKVSMLGLPVQIDTDMNSKYSFPSLIHKAMSKVTMEAVVFMDGSYLWNGNLRGLQVGFELWKQQPHTLVAAHNLEAPHPTNLPCPDDGEDMITPDKDSYWAAFCPESGGIPDDMNLLQIQYQNILDLSGVFVHRGLLCMLQQPPLSTLIHKVIWPELDDGLNPNDSLAYLRAIVALAMLQLSGSPPILFPPQPARPANVTQDYQYNWHYLPTKKEYDSREAVRANFTQVQQRVLVSMLGYFGQGISVGAVDGVVPYWCPSQKSIDDVFYMSDIPWLEGKPGRKC